MQILQWLGVCSLKRKLSACKVAMASRLPISKLQKMTLSRLPLSSNKENKLKYSFRARTKKGVVGEAETVELHFHSQISKKYRCVLCHHFLQHPCQVTCCGSFYCKECIDSLSRSSGKCASKKCGKNYSIITDGPALEELDRKIQLLKVYCLLKSSGCKWVGTIAQLEQNHYVYVDYNENDKMACQFQNVQCPNKCGASVPRGKMAEHHSSDCERALSKCEFCGMEDTSHNVFKVHQRMCLLMPVECPNKCGIPGIARSDILSHLENDCPLRLASCQYRHVGCDDRVRFTNLEEHNTSSYQKHLDLISEKMEFVSNENAKLRDENYKLHREVATLSFQYRELDAPFGSTDDSSGMGSARGTGSVELADTLSLSSLMDTVAASGNPKSDISLTDTTASGEDPQPNIKSGFESVIDELSYKMASEGELLSVKPKDQEGHRYMNVGLPNRKGLRDRPLSDGFYEILPDLCADVPQSKPTKEREASSGDLEGRYAIVKRKATKLPSEHATNDTIRETEAGSPDSDKVREESGAPSIDPIVGNHGYAIVKSKVTKPTSQKAADGTEGPCLDSAKSASGGDSVIDATGEEKAIKPTSWPATEAGFGSTCKGVSSTLGVGSILVNHPYETVKDNAFKPTLQPFGGKLVPPQQTEGQPGADNIKLLGYHHFGSNQDLPNSGDNIKGFGVNGEKSGRSHHISENSGTRKFDHVQPVGLTPSGPPATSANAFMDACPRPRSSAISAPSLKKYNPKISEAVKAKRRRTPPLPPLPPELPPKKSNSGQMTKPVQSTPSDSLAMESASSKIARTPIKPPIGTPPTTPTGIEHVQVGTPLHTASPCTDIGPNPVSVDASPEPFLFERANSEATTLFEPLSSEQNNSPTMSEAIMNRFPESRADEINSEFSIGSNGQPDSPPEQASSWHSTLVGAIKNSYRNLHRSLQSGSTHSLPTDEAKELKKELKAALKKRSSVLFD